MNPQRILILIPIVFSVVAVPRAYGQQKPLQFRQTGPNTYQVYDPQVEALKRQAQQWQQQQQMLRQQQQMQQIIQMMQKNQNQGTDNSKKMDAPASPQPAGANS